MPLKWWVQFLATQTIAFESLCGGLSVFLKFCFLAKLILAFAFYVDLLANPAVMEKHECFSVCCDRESEPQIPSVFSTSMASLPGFVKDINLSELTVQDRQPTLEPSGLLLTQQQLSALTRETNDRMESDSVPPSSTTAKEAGI